MIPQMYILWYLYYNYDKWYGGGVSNKYLNLHGFYVKYMVDNDTNYESGMQFVNVNDTTRTEPRSVSCNAYSTAARILCG
jgi:hypothetical protein